MEHRVFLEEADHPPPSYYDHPPTPSHPPEWASAPPFVPRSHQVLHSSFWPPSSDSSFPGSGGGFFPPPAASFGPRNSLPFSPLCPPLNPSSLPFVPQGYSANITNINAGAGPPIPAIVLKKKRRKRNRRSLLLSDSTVVAEEVVAPVASAIAEEGSTDMRAASDEIIRRASPFPPCGRCRLSRDASVLRGGSCPDLSEDQLRVWENLLYSRVVDHLPPPPPAPRDASEASLHSAYDILSHPLRDVVLDGLSPSVRAVDNEINGNVTSDSFVLSRLQEESNGNVSSDGTTEKEKALSRELQELLSFRPQMTRYGYPQYGDERAQLTTFHHSSGTTTSKMVNARDLMDEEDDDRLVEDSLEGLNIRVNAFHGGEEDDSLCEGDLPPPSRFEEIQWALKQKAARYSQIPPLRPPDRVCCTLM